MLKYLGTDKNFSLEGKTAIVTGGAAGIGKAIGEFFVKKNVKVLIADINNEVSEIAEKIDGNCEGILANITKNEDRQKILNKTLEIFSKVDILINCAGIVKLDKAEDFKEEWWDSTMEINLKASFMMAQLIGNQMIRQGEGVIVNIASQAGVVALDKHIAYCASKAAIISMTQVLAYEWGKYGIRVNAVSPTVVLTELGKTAWGGEKGEDMKKQIPALRFAEPDEIAACVAFLCSNGAAMITGANLMVDGGYTIK